MRSNYFSTNKIILLLFLLIGTSHQALKSQVTIGSGKQPAPFSVLEVVSESNSPGGLRSPQINNKAERDAVETLLKQDQVAGNSTGNGLVIYYVPSQEIQYWDGSKWVSVKSLKLNTKNGLSFDAANESIALGSPTPFVSDATLYPGDKSLSVRGDKPNFFNATTADGSSTLFSVDGQNKRIGIGTATPAAQLDVAGDANIATLRIGNISALANASVLVRDAATGLVGTAASVPARYAFLQSTKSQPMNSAALRATLNAGDPIVVEWSATDIVSNNIVDFDNANYIFTIRQDGFYEISGFIVYSVYAAIPATYPATVDAGRAGINVAIQVDQNDSKGWVDFTAARAIYSGTTVDNTAQTVNVPSGVSLLHAGTKIRMIFKRPNNAFGLAHGSSSNPDNTGISSAVGLPYTKGLRIMALQ